MPAYAGCPGKEAVEQCNILANHNEKSLSKQEPDYFMITLFQKGPVTTCQRMTAKSHKCVINQYTANVVNIPMTLSVVHVLSVNKVAYRTTHGSLTTSETRGANLGAQRVQLPKAQVAPKIVKSALNF